MKHPERFNADGTPRLIRFWDVVTNGSKIGTSDEGTHTDKDSRQVRRRKIFVFLFNHISRDRIYSVLPRANRRFWAHNTLMPEKKPSESTRAAMSMGTGD